MQTPQPPHPSGTVSLPPSSAVSATAETLLPHSPPLTGEAATLPPSAPGASSVASGPIGVPGYEILGELGRGGMGVVYRARQIKANRLVALKMILAGGHAGSDELTRFKTEGEALARLQHGNIVQVYDVGEHDGKPFFSLEYCGGGSLDRKMGGTPLPPLEAAKLVETLARAMHAAHQAHVVHRDLKPANVLLLPDGTPKITDFGLAKKLDQESGQTKTGAIMGTPSYMAPEQAEGKAKELGPLCDVYALGAMLYECLTGRPPFKAATVLDTVLQVVSQEPVPPSQLNAKVPRDLETVCLKCLQKDPGKRYDSALSLAEDLRRFQAGEPIAARPVGRVERAWRWCKRNPAVASLMGAVAASLVLGTVVATVFAIQASQARDEAEQLASAETAAKEDAIRTRNELAASNDNLLTSVARSLVRPLGVQVHPNYALPPLSDPEIETLWELGETKEEKLRLRFVQVAIRSPVTARQLRYRAEFALQAAVGLDTRRRDAVERLLLEPLSWSESPQELGTDVALVLAMLGDVRPQTKNTVAATLGQAMSKTVDPYALPALSQGMTAVAAQMDSREAAAAHAQAAAVLSQAMSKMPNYFALLPLSQELAAVAARMPPGEAATACTRAAASLIQTMTMYEHDPSKLSVLAQELAALSAWMEPRKAASACAEAAALLIPAIPKTQHYTEQDALVKGLAALAARMQSTEARETAALLTQAMSKTPVPSRMRCLSQGLAVAAARMEPREAREAVAILVRAMTATTDSFALQALSEGLAAVAARLDAAEAAGTCFQASAFLTRAMTRTKEAFQLQPLMQGLTALAAHMDSREAAALMTQVMTRITDANALSALSEGLVAVAARIPPREAAVLCGQASAVLTRAVSETSQPYVLRALSQGLKVLAARMDSSEAKAAAAALSQALSKTTISLALQALSEGLSAVAARMEPREASAILTQAISKTTDNTALQVLSQGLAALPARMSPSEAKEAAALLTQAMSETTTTLVSRALSQGLAALAARMTPREAAAALTQAMSKTTDPLAVLALSQGLAAVAARLEPREAAATCSQAAAILTQAMTGTMVLSTWPVLSKGLAAVAAGMDPREATAALTQAMSKTTDPLAVLALSQGLAATAARMDTGEAAAVCARAAAALTQALTRAADPNALNALSQGLAAQARRMDPKEAKAAAAALTQAMSKTGDHTTMRALSRGLAAVAARLEPREAAAVCVPAAALLTQAMSKTTALYPLEAYSQGLTDLAERIAPSEAKEAAADLIQAMSKTRDPRFVQTLSQALARVLLGEYRSGVRRRAAAVAATIGTPAAGCWLPASLAPGHDALQPLPCRLSTQQLAALLKHPFCVGTARRVVLDQLENRHTRKLADQWDFVRFAEEKKLGLDLATPPQRPDDNRPAIPGKRTFSP